jgi:hypothetical protein
MSPANPFERRYLQTRNMRTEAAAKLKGYDAIMGKVEQELDALKGMVSLAGRLPKAMPKRPRRSKSPGNAGTTSSSIP